MRYLLVPATFMQNVDGAASPANCPTRLAVEIISGKWAVLTLFGLSQKPRRHGELVDLIGGVSRKVLTQTLRRLQQYGLVDRHAEAPRRVKYSRVNTITPGPTDTPGLSGLAPDPEQAAGLRQGLAAQMPLGRLGRPEEIAAAVTFLASEQSSFITGSSLYVDGGLNQI